MKMKSILTAVMASASLLTASASFALPLPVLNMTGAAAVQSLAVSGCRSIKTTDTVNVTFLDDGTYTITDSGLVPVLNGTWYKVNGRTPASPYVIYMAPDVYAPGPLDPPGAPAGTLDDFLNQLEVTAQTPYPAGMACTLRNGGVQAITVLQPTTLVKRSQLNVATRRGGGQYGVLTFDATAVQSNQLAGIQKMGILAVKLAVSGTVTP